ncbi:MAG: C69 family dipeptidase [Clostridia bacterium]|nr:C69 family dipeptidase [Clostridia bacterium]
MCDSMVVDSKCCTSGKTVFAKASDRAVNEPQPIIFVPAADHAPGERVKCTYIEVDQVAHTNAMILSKPSWIWGAEIGVNEHGVCIGNETIFSKDLIPGEEEDALLGMDIVRLVLERASSAREAVDVMADIMERYGQGGNAGFDTSFHYDNAYLIADEKEAWHFETAGKHLWAAKKVDGAYTISNYLSINYPDLMHKDLISNAVERGYDVEQPFDFSHAYADWESRTNRSGMQRRCCSYQMVNKWSGNFDEYKMMKVLRTHYANDEWVGGGCCVCMHSNPPALSQTCSAIVAVCQGKDTLMWTTGMGITCVAPFQPCWFDAYSKKQVFPYENMEDGIKEWIRREGINRAILAGKICPDEYKKELYAMEADWHARVDSVSPDRESRQALCDAIADEADAFISKWLAKAAEAGETQHRGPEEFVEYWTTKNEALGKDHRIAK